MMKISTLFQRVLILIVFISSSGYSGENGSLHPEDVKKVMTQIFNQHMQKKEITAEIINNSFKIYIDQFDPDRVYLLDNEVRSFTDLNKNEVRRILRQYQRNDFSAYQRLNNVIQMAIKRARDYRQALFRSQETYINQTNIDESFQKNTYSQGFARNAAELKYRQKRQLQDFINMEVARFGGGVMKSKEAKIRKAYDSSMREHERKYLFTDSSERLLTANERENLFYMHIIKALAKSLDAHTSFFNESEAYDMRVRLEKGFDGLGIVLNKDIFGYRIVKLIPGSPAEKNKSIVNGDYLVRVNGKMIEDRPLGEVMKMLRGKKGTLVSLQFKREKGKGEEQRISNFTVLLKREPIVIDEGRVELSSMKFGDGLIGTIKLHSFYQGTNGISSEQDVRKAIKQLEKVGNLRGLVLDLRENSGGFLTQAVKVAGLFITNGVIVVSQYSSGEKRYYRDMDGKVSYQGPLIVLTSRATASAAEIVAQALQDYGVALVVGDEQTYGKGTIQSQTVTDDNRGGSYFKVTVGKYYTVSGKTPQVEGVKADVVVPSPYSLEQVGEEYLEYPLTQDTIPDSYEDTLSDIDPGLRPWYLRYYMPTLQQKNQMWRGFLPLLKHNSQNRLSNSLRYDEYLEKARFDDEHEYSGDQIADLYGDQDPQLHEAVNIVKDMIILESKAKGNQRIGVTDIYLLSD
ncbi:MAG: S41 family peptidase [Chlamydiota bacterium]